MRRIPSLGFPGPPASVVLAPGGPGLGPETLSGLALPPDAAVTAAASAGTTGDPFAAQAALLADRLAEASATGPTVVVGHSAGARAAIRVAAARPAGLAGVVLIAAQVRDRLDDPELLADRVAALTGDLGATARLSLGTDPSQAPADDTTFRRFLVADLAATLPEIGPAQRALLELCGRTWDVGPVRRLFAGPAPDDLSGAVAAIDVPVLVVNGAADPWAGPRSAAELGDLLRFPEVHVVPGAGHVPWLDRAWGEAGPIGRWLSSTERVIT